MPRAGHFFEGEKLEAIYPEQRLWAAVITMLIDDYRSLLMRIISLRDRKQPVNLLYLRQLEALKREAQHEWFHVICGHINIDASHVVTRLDKFDEEFELSKIIFTNAAISDYRRQTLAAKEERQREKHERKNMRTGRSA